MTSWCLTAYLVSVSYQVVPCTLQSTDCLNFQKRFILAVKMNHSITICHSKASTFSLYRLRLFSFKNLNALNRPCWSRFSFDSKLWIGGSKLSFCEQFGGWGSHSPPATDEDFHHFLGSFVGGGMRSRSLLEVDNFQPVIWMRSNKRSLVTGFLMLSHTAGKKNHYKAIILIRVIRIIVFIWCM